MNESHEKDVGGFVDKDYVLVGRIIAIFAQQRWVLPPDPHQTEVFMMAIEDKDNDSFSKKMHTVFDENMYRLATIAMTLGEEVTAYCKVTDGNYANHVVALAIYYKPPDWWNEP